MSKIEQGMSIVKDILQKSKRKKKDLQFWWKTERKPECCANFAPRYHELVVQGTSNDLSSSGYSSFSDDVLALFLS